MLELFSQRTLLNLDQLGAIYNISINDLSGPVNWLLKCGYLAKYNSLDENMLLTPDTFLLITYEGKSALEKEAKNRKTFKYNELRAWITLVIAIAAFIKSFMF